MRTSRHAFLGIGVLGSAASAACWAIDSRQFFEAWLIGWFYWLSIALACLGLLMIYQLTGGEWGDGLKRILISASRTIELLLLLFLPLFAALRVLYPWTHPELVSADEALRHKHAYLNIAF